MTTPLKRNLRKLRDHLNNRVISKLEKRSTEKRAILTERPPVFILGAPRCGSTLLMQTMAKCLDIGYLSNQHCKLYGAPSAIHSILARGFASREITFVSKHGSTPDVYGPSECPGWWYRFFPRAPEHISTSQMDPKALQEFRMSVEALAHSFDRPLFFKNLYASLRLKPIMHALPESLFIVIRRDLGAQAHSILEARFRNTGDYGAWFSMKIPDTQSVVELPPHEQVISQITGIHKIIDEDLPIDRFSERRMDVSYEDFCRSPAGVLQGVIDFVSQSGVILRERAPPPEPFPVNYDVRIDPELYKRLQEYLGTMKL